MKPSGLALAMLVALLPQAAAQALEETWVEVEGSATLSATQTADQVARDALKRAQSRAVEQVTGSTISDEVMSVRDRAGQLRLFREMRSSLGGRLVQQTIQGWRVEARSVQPEEPPLVTYIVSLRAKVAREEPVDPGFRVGVSLSKRTLRSGEALYMTIDATSEAHLAVFNLAANDRVYPIYPNRYHPTLKVAPAQSLTLPSPNDSFELRPRTLPGHPSDRESLKVVASRDPLLMPSVAADGSLSLTDFYRWLVSLPASKRAEATVEYDILD